MDELPFEVPPAPPSLDELPDVERGTLALRRLTIAVACVALAAGGLWLWRLGARSVRPLRAQPALSASVDATTESTERGVTGQSSEGRAPDSTARSSSPAPEQVSLETLWARGSACSGVATDSGRSLIAIAESGECVQCTAEGELVASFPLAGRSPALRAGNLDGDAALEIVAFDYWSTALHAYDDDGAPLWSYEREGTSVNEVWLADLGTDGICEVLLGWTVFSQSATSPQGGAAVLDSGGEIVWEDASIGPTPFVTAGDVNGDGATEVLAQGWRGAVLYRPDGTELETYHPFGFTQMAFAIGRPVPGCAATWVAASSPAPTAMVVGNQPTGDRAWETTLGVNQVVGAGPAQIARTRPWAFIPSAYPGGIVIDLSDGAIVARDDVPCTPGESAWFEPSGADEPLLVLVAGGIVRLMRVHPLPPDEAGAASGPQGGPTQPMGGTMARPGGWGGQPGGGGPGYGPGLAPGGGSPLGAPPNAPPGGLSMGPAPGSTGGAGAVPPPRAQGGQPQ